MQPIQVMESTLEETDTLYGRILAHLSRIADKGVSCIVCRTSYWTPGVSTIEEHSPESERVRIGHLGCISCGYRMWFELPAGLR